MSIDLLPEEEDEEPIVITKGHTPEVVAEKVKAQMEDRRTYIGGSDAAAALGLNPWKDRYALWEEKTGMVTPEDIGGIDAVYWGTVLEDVVAQEFMRRTGLVVRRQPKLVRHSRLPFMGAHVDRIILNSDGGLEVKTTGREGEAWGEEGTDEIPQHYFIQVQHYMAVTERRFFEIALLAGGQRFRRFHVERDETFIANLEELEAEFWECVTSGNPPNPETSAEANRRWPKSREGEVQADADLIATVTRLGHWKQEIKEAEEGCEKMELSIKTALGETGDTLMAGTRKLATWKTQPNNRFDFEAFKVAYPNLVELYTPKDKTMRVLRLAKQK